MTTRRRSMNGYGTSGSAKIDQSISELKSVHNTIQYEWPDFLEERANPIETAVGLLDDTSVGMAYKYPAFTHLKQSTEDALRVVVNEHHELFNNSVGSYHSLLASLKDSQEDSKEIKEMLEATTKDIQDRSDILSELSQTSTRYAEMIEILDAITEITSIQDKIEQLVADKKIHQVYDVISNGYIIAEKYNLWSLPAMSSIQSYLEIQSNNLFDMIIDELQNEIYLKNHTSSTTNSTQLVTWQSLINTNNPKLSSLKSLITESNNLEQYIYNSANLDLSDISQVFTEASQTFLSTQLPKLQEHYSKNTGEINYSILLESQSTLSSESFHYIYMLLFTASKLNRLHQIVEILSNNNQSEVHGLINRTIEEVKSKNLGALTKLAKLQNFDHSNSDIIGNNNFSDSAIVILQDLFGGVFIKSLAVLQRHKVVSEIVHVIESGARVQRGGKVQPKSYEIDGIWKSMSKELQSLMISYIYESPVMSLNGTETLANLDKNRLFEVLQKKDIFRFEDVTYDRSAKSPEDLQIVLQEMFPGFVLSDAFKEKNDAPLSASPYIKNESFNLSVEVLVPKNLFNMRIILEFFLIFIAGSQRVFSNFETTDPRALVYFDNFMKTYFLSHVKESLDVSFREFVGGNTDYTKKVMGLKLDLISLDYKQSESGEGSSPEKFIVIYQNALDFKRLFLNICSVLNTSIAYREEISSTALNFLQNFSNAYMNFYKELLSTGGEYNEESMSGKPVPQISKWMRIPDLVEVSESILESEDASVNAVTSLQKPISLENRLLLVDHGVYNLNLNKDDLLDNESFNHVCYLLLTTSWILTWLPLLKKESNYGSASGKGQISSVDQLREDWSFLENGRSVITVSTGNTDIGQQNVYLALNTAKIATFNEIVQKFELIKHKTLLALRYDLRCKAVYYIGKSFSQTDWMPFAEPSDADQFIASLNKEVFSIDNKLTKFLNDRERDSLFLGLSEFLNDLVIQGSRSVASINNNGIKKILLNIYTLQQMLRNVLKNPETVNFTRASVYFDLFPLNEFNFLNIVKANEHGYSRQDYANMAKMVYSEKLAGGAGTQFNKTKYSELLKKIDIALA